MKKMLVFWVLLSLSILWANEALPEGWEPQFEELQEMKVVGMQSFLSSKYNLIGPLWERFMNRLEEVPDKKYTDVAVGVSYAAEVVSEGSMEYHYFHVVGLPVTGVDKLPEGMCWINVPAGSYAKFTHVGPLDNLEEIYNYIYMKWLPQSGYLYDTTRVDMEWYGAEFDYGKELSKMYIYVPIMKKEAAE